MSKINKDTIQNICKDYVENRIAIKKIASKYNIDWRKVKEILLKNNIQIRNNSECQKVYVSKETIGDVCKYYLEGYTYNQCCNKFKLKKNIIFNIIHSNVDKKLIRTSGSYFKGSPRTNEVKEKISKANKNHYVSQKQRTRLSSYNKSLPKEELKIRTSKAFLTRKKNNTLNSSEPEQKLYETLLKENVNKTIYRNYKCSRYPFYCDFYIVEDDLFIELNAHWTHGGRPYDENDEECQKQLLEWKEKAKTSKFYATAIEVWTVRDVEKQRIAKENKLNYKVIY